MKKILILLALIAAAPVHAESTNFVSFTGKVLNFDMDHVRLQDRLGQVWEVPREVFPDETNWGAIRVATVRVFRWHLKKISGPSQTHHR